MQNRMNSSRPEKDPILNHIQRDNSGFQKHLHDGEGVILLVFVRQHRFLYLVLFWVWFGVVGVVLALSSSGFELCIARSEILGHII